MSQGVRLRVYNLGFGVWGLGFIIGEGSGFRVHSWALKMPNRGPLK